MMVWNKRTIHTAAMKLSLCDNCDVGGRAVDAFSRRNKSNAPLQTFARLVLLPSTRVIAPDTPRLGKSRVHRSSSFCVSSSIMFQSRKKKGKVQLLKVGVSGED